jgi:hypothetical protein
MIRLYTFDLRVRRLASSGPDILTVSADHHVGQPAHGRLRFDGGQSPDRGAVLETSASAVLNSMKFERLHDRGVHQAARPVRGRPRLDGHPQLGGPQR